MQPRPLLVAAAGLPGLTRVRATTAAAMTVVHGPPTLPLPSEAIVEAAATVAAAPQEALAAAATAEREAAGNHRQNH